MKLTCLRKVIHAMIMGPPGSGKGTMSARIIHDFDIKHISSGDILRTEIANNTAYGIEASSHTLTGKLVPDDLIVDLVLSQIEKLSLTTNWLLDGFPRNISQAHSLVQRERLDAVINLDVPFTTIQQRLSGRWTHLPSGRIYNESFNPPQRVGIDDVTGENLVQRDDDKPETVQKRLDIYLEETEPMLDFFREMDILHSYSGTKTDDIWPSVRRFLQNIVLCDARQTKVKSVVLGQRPMKHEPRPGF